LPAAYLAEMKANFRHGYRLDGKFTFTP
jgi:hypothetical protein